MISNRFFVVALPRSRTAWLANLLTCGNVSCGHESLIGCSSIADLERKLQATGTEVSGTADTGLPLVLDRVIKAYPAARFVCVVREGAGFVEQAMRLNLGATPEDLAQLLDDFRASVEKLVQLGPQTMVVRPRQLDEFSVCQSVFAHVGGSGQLNRARFDMLRDMKVEIFIDRMQRKAEAHIAELHALLGDDDNG